MKKLISSAIIILPLLLLAILLVSGAIMSLITHIYVESVEFVDKKELVLFIDENEGPNTATLDVTVLPLNAKEKKVLFKAGSDIVEVDEDGVVTAKDFGETYITVVSDENKAATAQRKVIVTSEHVHRVEFNEHDADLYEGESRQLSVSVLPTGAENKAVQWSLADPSQSNILEVRQNGRVTAKGEGSVIVKATAVDDVNGAFAQTTINCHARLDGLTVDDSLCETAEFTAQFPTFVTVPSPCFISKIEYAADDESVAEVNGQGAITFKKSGRVTVTLTVTDFGGNKQTKSKTYVCTDGYFKSDLFSTHRVDIADCEVGRAIPISFAPMPTGAYRLIGEIACAVDADDVTDDSPKDYITYDPANKQFVLAKEFPEFNNKIYVKVTTRVYDDSANIVKDSFDYFYIIRGEVGNSIKVTMDGSELTDGAFNLIAFDDIGVEKRLVIENPDRYPIRLDGNSYVSAQRNDDEITLTSLAPVSASANAELSLSIGPNMYRLKLSVSAKAQEIHVYHGESELVVDTNYKTLPDSLTFTVKKQRSDGIGVTSVAQYRLNGTGDWMYAADDTFTVDTVGLSNIEVRCDNAPIVAINIEKVELPDFGIAPSYTNSKGEEQTLPAVPSVYEQAQTMYKLPFDMQGSVTFKITLDEENYLGGFGTDEDFENLFSVTLSDEQHHLQVTDYIAVSREIVFTTSSTEFEATTVTISHGTTQQLKISVQLVKMNIKEVNFVNEEMSFDSNSDSDVHKGYQQVRVFAKHSSYEGEQVDYFRIPFNALSNLQGEKANIDTVTWELFRFVGNEIDSVITTQIGKSVFTGGKTLTIALNNDEYVLKDGDRIVSGEGGKNNDGYIWVDPYTEQAQSIARVYFGSFQGLTESDVQNDFFGNFDDAATWKKVSQDTSYHDESGRTFEPSQNAYSFLRVQAGDGAIGGVNSHFNFNVLDDNELVNVFNVQGYLANSKIVLHENIYGKGEQLDQTTSQKATDKGLILESVDAEQINKDTIYGNGYKINYNAKNDEIHARKGDSPNYDEPSASGTTGGGVIIERAYNVKLEGSDINVEEISRTKQQTNFMLVYGYYSEVNHYGRIVAKDNLMCLKNMGMRASSVSAIMIHRDGAKYYLENIAITESTAGLSLEKSNNTQTFLKGSFEVLNYANKSGLQNMLNLPEYLQSMIPEVLKMVVPLLEWHGRVTTDPYATDELYVNILIYSSIKLKPDESTVLYYWENDDYKDYKYQVVWSAGTGNVSGELANGYRLKAGMTVLNYNAWTYDYDQSLEGTTLELGNSYEISSQNRDITKAFTPERYIRLLCEYKTYDVKNFEHILWHMQTIYRDMSLLTERTNDHIQALKDSLKNTTWKDGTGVNDNGEIIGAQVAAMNEIMSSAVTRKESY